MFQLVELKRRRRLFIGTKSASNMDGGQYAKMFRGAADIFFGVREWVAKLGVTRRRRWWTSRPSHAAAQRQTSPASRGWAKTAIPASETPTQASMMTTQGPSISATKDATVTHKQLGLKLPTFSGERTPYRRACRSRILIDISTARPNRG